jgi:hypothetical protein
VLPVAATILLALGGYFGTYLNNLRIAQRKDRLDRINRQLARFYGPLLALTTTHGSVIEVFVQMYQQRGAQPALRDGMQVEGEAIFKLWWQEVFLPLHSQMLDILINRTDLIRESKMPEVLLLAGAALESRRGALAQWELGDLTAMGWTPALPEDLVTYAADGFAELKLEQAQLLGTQRSTRRPSPWQESGRALGRI